MEPLPQSWLCIVLADLASNLFPKPRQNSNPASIPDPQPRQNSDLASIPDPQLRQNSDLASIPNPRPRSVNLVKYPMLTKLAIKY